MTRIVSLAVNKGAKFGIIIVAIIVVGVLSSPLFYDTAVDEAIPVPGGSVDLEEFPNMDESERDALVEEMADEEKNAIMDEFAGTVSEVSEDMAGDSEDAVTIVSSGEFEGLYGHSAAGTAKIITVDGQNYLRFEDFSVTNGPDLKVYLTPTGNVDDGTRLADLKGSRGAQNYALDASELDGAGFVVIYCQPFHVYFASAELT